MSRESNECWRWEETFDQVRTQEKLGTISNTLTDVRRWWKLREKVYNFLGMGKTNTKNKKGSLIDYKLWANYLCANKLYHQYVCLCVLIQVIWLSLRL